MSLISGDQEIINGHDRPPLLLFINRSITNNWLEILYHEAQQ